MKHRFLTPALSLASLLLVLSFSTVMAASSVTLNGYQFDFLGTTTSGNVTTFTYAVTADGDNDEDNSGGLSHWTIGIGTCDPIFIVSPPESPLSYTTPTTHPSCGTTYNCLSAEYPEVEYGLDSTTGVDGIKFGDANDEQLAADNTGTHIFEISLTDVTGTTDVLVGAKNSGNTGPSGLITGPVCGGPTAVAMGSTTAQSGGGLPVGVIAITLLLGLITFSHARLMLRPRPIE